MQLKSNLLTRLLVFSGICSVALMGMNCSSNNAEKPNIVFIMADDMGYGDLTCYNPESKISTPNMDQLADEGIRFTDAHSPASLCTPSRYGLLTGRYCWRTRLKKGVLLGYDESPLIKQDRATLGSLMKKNGYRTACIGKWHLGLSWQTKDGYVIQDDKNEWKGYKGTFKENSQHIDFSKPIEGGPVDLGFDYFFGTAGCSTSDPPYAFIENRRTVGIPSVETPEELNKLPGFVPGLMVPGWSEEDVDPVFTSKSIEFISNHQEETPDKPFFLYLSLSSPHIPFLPPDFVKGESREGPRGDLVKLVDWSVGKVLKTIDSLGLKGNTLVVVTSDNGPRKGANGHKSAGNFRGYKASIWEGGHRVPFIARWPKKIKPGTTSDATISLTDMFATFAELTNSQLVNNNEEDSYNVLPAMLGSEVQTDTCARIFHSVAGVFAIRKGKWKLIQGTKGSGKGRVQLNDTTGQLYDLEADPYEKNDLWNEKPEVVNRLTKYLTEIKEQGE